MHFYENAIFAVVGQPGFKGRDRTTCSTDRLNRRNLISIAGGDAIRNYTKLSQPEI